MIHISKKVYEQLRSRRVVILDEKELDNYLEFLVRAFLCYIVYSIARNNKSLRNAIESIKKFAIVKSDKEFVVKI